jgi:large subunit ribosomal protein L24
MQTAKPIKDPRKQRKLLHNAPAHLRHKLMAAPLASQLAASKNVKTLPVRKGDTVRIMRGDNKGFEGKISRVDLKNYRIYIEGLTREKVDGTAVFIAVHPSKVMIKNLNLNDKWRKAIVERKEELPKREAKAEKAVKKPSKIVEKAEKVAKKPPAKAAKVEKEVKEIAKEKPVKVKEKVAEAKVTIEEKPKRAKPKAKPATAPTKPQKKSAPKKKKEEKPVEEKKPAEKEKKLSAPKTAKKTRAKRKTTSEKRRNISGQERKNRKAKA